MSTATDDTVIYRDPVAGFEFSAFETTYATDEERRRLHASKATASLFMAGMLMAGGLCGTTVGGENPFASKIHGGRTIRGELAPLPVDPSPVRTAVVTEAIAHRSDRDEIAWIKEHSGLTWDQLGKVFGVSRRAVHMWANGGRLNEANAQRLREFASIIQRLEAETPGTTPETIRARLNQVDTDGYSIIGRLRQERSGGPSWGAPFGPERLVDAIRAPLRVRAGEVGL
ncbi:Uncharacterised protein [Mycobacteroides abscessus subsp. massiliense]|uniref:hypothetical protein n=1 Tax=Mycobacteroides abscessus TaxID=36809 RepID=UPI0009A67329|nr:hypothetical protein [Mycobacteroides abscessus]SKE39939.1 Uncharacterised protein [Mycobacteroides abscessus subsp. massiliense]SKE48179.1 Uncharacterised protein [Mycobacteroides abscessus subsp. massiliense]SKG08093.1 Uncharacterised protein [Mycobacteroides abscessus subsp. massiliense]SKG25058.1 Uncharacterised protein [Mycobacteroides abscessus subsp. massiliense]SKG50441.1 Uncharacterised protein [Mycobacteroides abscessus subsp. massiliense]